MPRDVFPRTISRGVLTGRTFASKWEYQQARARALGFRSYGAERGAKQNPLFIVVRERSIARGESRSVALRVAQRIVGDTRIPKNAEGTHAGSQRGQEMRRVIQQVMDEGLWDSGQDAADDLFYE